MELASSDSRGYQRQADIWRKELKTPHKLPLGALPGSEGRCQGKFILGEQVWLFSPAPFKHVVRFSSLVTKELPRKASPEDLGRAHPSFPLSVALSFVKVAEACSWAPALGRKGTPSTSAFGGKLWLSSSARPREWPRLTHAQQDTQHGG